LDREWVREREGVCVVVWGGERLALAVADGLATRGRETERERETHLAAATARASVMSTRCTFSLLNSTPALHCDSDPSA
jgi:hypothetical protein